MSVFRHPQSKDNIKIGPNAVHAQIIHGPGRSEWAEGEVEDLGTSYNVLTTANNGGRDMAAALVADHLLLPADADAYVKAARECDRF